METGYDGIQILKVIVLFANADQLDTDGDGTGGQIKILMVTEF